MLFNWQGSENGGENRKSCLAATIISRNFIKAPTTTRIRSIEDRLKAIQPFTPTSLSPSGPSPTTNQQLRLAPLGQIPQSQIWRKLACTRLTLLQPDETQVTVFKETPIAFHCYNPDCFYTKCYLQKPILNILRNTTCDVTNMHSMEILTYASMCFDARRYLFKRMLRTRNGRQIGVPDCHMTWLWHGTEQ